jgi:hypothetical protein
LVGYFFTTPNCGSLEQQKEEKKRQTNEEKNVQFASLVYQFPLKLFFVFLLRSEKG